MSENQSAEKLDGVEPHKERSIRILQAEDDANVRASIRMNLAVLGFIPESAGTGMEALKKFSEQNGNFDAVMTDYDMPGMKGTELLVEIAKMKPEITKILLSGREKDDPDIIRELDGLELDFHLKKPDDISIVKLEEIMQKINERLENEGNNYDV